VRGGEGGGPESIATREARPSTTKQLVLDEGGRAAPMGRFKGDKKCHFAEGSAGLHAPHSNQSYRYVVTHSVYV